MFQSKIDVCFPILLVHNAKGSPAGHMPTFFAQHFTINPPASSGQVQRIVGCLFIFFKIVKKEIKMIPYFV